MTSWPPPALVLTAGLGSLTEVYLGYLDSAWRMAQRGIAIAHDVQHPFSIGMALALASVVAIERKDTAAATALAAQCIRICEEQGLPNWADFARVTSGLARALEGDPQAAPAYWLLAIRTGGSMMAPSEDWP